MGRGASPPNENSLMANLLVSKIHACGEWMNSSLFHLFTKTLTNSLIRRMYCLSFTMTFQSLSSHHFVRSFFNQPDPASLRRPQSGRIGMDDYRKREQLRRLDPKAFAELTAAEGTARLSQFRCPSPYPYPYPSVRACGHNAICLCTCVVIGSSCFLSNMHAFDLSIELSDVSSHNNLSLFFLHFDFFFANISCRVCRFIAAH
jgi:hypothetical protein